MSKIKFEIITPEREVFRDEIDQLTAPTQEGEITILPGHIPLVTILVAGEIRAKKDNQEVLMAVSGGFLEVLKNKVVILADTAERAEEIDERRAGEARRRAEELKAKKVFDQVEFATLQGKIEKELARLRVVYKHRQRGNAPSVHTENK